MIQICLILLFTLGTLGLPQYNNNNSTIEENLRTKRQVAGTFMCVPVGTCITGSAPGYIGVDPRIVVPGGVTPTTAPPITNTCPAGQEVCYPTPTPPLCGQRIVSNVNTASGPSTFGAYPWQAYIRNQTSFGGSGVLLDSTTVLTVAHKVYRNLLTPSNIQVYMGVYDPTTASTTAQMRTASQIILNPGSNFSYLNPNFFNDIAIIKLSSPIALGYQTNIGIACLPTAGSSYVGSTNCYVAGWGQSRYLQFDAPVSPQKQANLPIVSYATCRASYASILTNVDYFLDPVGELCAGGSDSLDACQQDGGAPLVCPDATTGRFTVVGLVNWGKGCGRAGVYGVYVDVSKYLPWIQQNMSPIMG